jgi:hypothetical protein
MRGSAPRVPSFRAANRRDFCEREARTFDRIRGGRSLGGDAGVVAHGGTLMAILEARALPRRDFYAWQVPPGRGYAAEYRGGTLEICSSL